MIIIVEGPDGSGKDTFIENLVKLTGMKHVRGSSFEISQRGPEGMFKKWKKMLMEEDDIIINRFCYSNLVYGPMYGYPTITHEQATELNELINDRAVVYYIDADTDIIVDRIERRGDDDIKPEEIKDLQASYDHMWKLMKPRMLVTIDSSDNSLLDISSHVYERVLAYNYVLDKMVRTNSKLQKGD